MRYTNAQYKKGVLELCVLCMPEQKDCYGYEISDTLSGRIDIADGTVYPILRKLKSDGMLTTCLQEESGGPPRKYYTITELDIEIYAQDNFGAGTFILVSSKPATLRGSNTQMPRL